MQVQASQFRQMANPPACNLACPRLIDSHLPGNADFERRSPPRPILGMNQILGPAGGWERNIEPQFPHLASPH